MRSAVLFLFLFLLLASPAVAADPPGLAVADSEPKSLPQAGAISVAAGRFVPLSVAGGKPALVLGNEAGLLELFPLPAGHTVLGVRWDEPAGAKAKRYTFPAGPVTIALAGDTGGSVTLKAVVNGPADGPPTVAGTLVLTLTGPLPPPGPAPGPGPGPGPAPLTPFQTKLKAAIAADGATADYVAKYAAYWRTGAKVAQDGGLTTAGALDNEMLVSIRNFPGLPHGSLNNTAKAVQDEIKPLLPKSPATPLESIAVPPAVQGPKPTRDLYSATYARIAADLEAAQK